jgi:hypothetical protein
MSDKKETDAILRQGDTLGPSVSPGRAEGSAGEIQRQGERATAMLRRMGIGPADELHELADVLRGVQDRLRPIAIAQEQLEGEPVEGSRRLERLRQCYTELSVLIGHMEQVDG